MVFNDIFSFIPFDAVIDGLEERDDGEPEVPDGDSYNSEEGLVDFKGKDTFDEYFHFLRT